MTTTYTEAIRQSTPQADFANVLAVLRRETPSRPTLFEFFTNNDVYRTLTGVDCTGMEPLDAIRVGMRAYYRSGYDYYTLHGSAFGFPRNAQQQAASISQNEGVIIVDRATFDAYRWPNPDDFDYSRLDLLAPELPDGMQFIVHGPGGVLENVTFLVGFENMCYLLADDPELLHAIFDAVGARLVRYYEICAPHPAVGALISNDDWGFRTATMFPPEAMRDYVIPWHQRIAATIHAAGKPAILHSCGNLAEVMDDIIDVIGYQGKHSYEDAIQPVEEAYEQYGSRIALLGGIDVDFICRSTPEEVYARSAAMLERTATRGGYALGSGNSIPAYVPQEHYFAMIAAAVLNR